MDAIKHPTTTHIFGAPAGWDQEKLPCGSLPVTHREMAPGVPSLCSYWKPTAAELDALNAGGLIALSIVGQGMPPVALFGIRPTEIVSGKARGVDKLGEDWAAARGIPVKSYPARWRDPDGTYYPNAGHFRNTIMARYADALVAIWDGVSKGTADMIKKAQKQGIEVWVHRV